MTLSKRNRVLLGLFCWIVSIALFAYAFEPKNVLVFVAALLLIFAGFFIIIPKRGKPFGN